MIPSEKRSHRKRTALVSIHDVMPSNLDNILEIIVFLKRAGVRSVTLLIVPGREWRSLDIALLKKLQADTDIELAGHGWRHRTDRFATLHHRLHGMLLSRKEAEHMSLPADGIVDLVERNHGWFKGAGLKAPDLYVPPAWAMGKLPRKRLRPLPFRYYETMTGVYDSCQGKMQPMAVCGYMADSRNRSLALRATNAVNRQIFPYPLRIAIHPEDLKLSMAADLASCLNKDFHFSTYASFFNRRGADHNVTRG